MSVVALLGGHLLLAVIDVGLQVARVAAVDGAANGHGRAEDLLHGALKKKDNTQRRKRR